MKRKQRGFWTKEKSFEEALKFISRSSFKSTSGGAYNVLKDNNWLDEACNHMVPIGNRFNRLVYAYEFTDNYVYVGLTFNLKERDEKHKRSKRSAVYQHIQKTNITPSLITCSDYLEVTKAQILEGETLEKYKEKGYNILNKAKTGAVGGHFKWTKERCLEEAIKCKKRKEFVLMNNSAYNSARRYGWLNEICSHMDTKEKKKLNYWTKERCLEEALRCKKLSEIDSGAYQSIRRNSWEDELYSHLIIQKSNGYWTKERCLEEALKHKTIDEFKKSGSYGYRLSVSNKWLTEFFKKI